MRNAIGFLVLVALVSSYGEEPQKSSGTGASDQDARSAVSKDVPPLETSAPQEQGVDPERLDAAYRHAETLRPLLSLLLLRNGVIVGEGYFHGADRNTAHNIKSVSKSILAALTGIAVEQGFIKSLDQPISEFFPDYFEPPSTKFEGWSSLRAKTDRLKRQVTIRQVLMQTTGFVWTESDPFFNAWLWSSDYLRFFLELPFAAEPGEKFIYNTGGTHALSALLARASGMTTKEFADRYLFALIGMEVRRWDQAPEGTYIGGAEMHFTARSMARFGQLHLNAGRWDGEQVLTEEWVRESTGERVKADYETPKEGPNSESWVWSFLEPGNFTGYGYLWWRRETAGHETFVGLGYGGQFIFVIPNLQLVLAATSSWDPETNPDRYRHYAQFFDLVDNYIIPAVND